MINLNTELTSEIECSLLRIRALGVLFCLVQTESNIDVTDIWRAMGCLLVASADEALEVLEDGYV